MSLRQANDSETFSTMRFGSVCRGAAATNAGRNRSKAAAKQLETQLNVFGCSSDRQVLTTLNTFKHHPTMVPKMCRLFIYPY